MRVMMTAIVCLLTLWGRLPAGDPAPDQTAREKEARAQFQQGVEKLRSAAESRRAFAAAAKAYRELHESGMRSPALYLSLGNAEALAGRWPQALWAYHCGLKLDPNHALLRQHRDYARTLVNYPPSGRGRPRADGWPDWLYRPASGPLFVIAALSYTLTCFAAAWWYVRRRHLAVVLALVGITLACWIGYVYTDGRAEYDRQYPVVIVTGDGTPLHRGNGPNYELDPDLPNLPAGLEARLLHRRGGWLQIQLAGGEVGWTSHDSVLVVAPWSSEDAFAERH